MRILDVNNFYAPTGGGVRTYHHRKLAYCAKAEGVTAALAVPDTAWARQETGDGGLVYRIPSLPLGGTGYRMITGGRHLTRAVDDFRPDIIEIGSGYFLPGIMKRIADPLRIPRVGFYHADYPDTLVAMTLGRIPLLGRSIVSGCWKRVGRTYGDMAAVFAASRTVLSKLRTSGIRRLFYVPLGVDHEVFSPVLRSRSVREEAGATDGRKMLLYLARLNPEKGIDLLMEAWPQIRDPENAVLVIVGTGVLGRRVKRFADSFPEVTLLPFADDHREVAGYMASCDVFLSLGAYETFCLATLEAMASGAVVVAPDSGGAGELVGRGEFGAKASRTCISGTLAVWRVGRTGSYCIQTPGRLRPVRLGLSYRPLGKNRCL